MPEVNATSTATIAPAIAQRWLRKELLTENEQSMVFAELGLSVDMPAGEGKTIEFHRFARLPLPDAPLVEGTTPTAIQLTMGTVTAMLDQWGGLVSLTDVAVLTSTHPLMQVAKQRLGEHGSRLWDRELQRVLMGGANVVFPNGRTARSQLIAGDTLLSDLCALVTATLRQLGAPTFGNRGAYAGVADPFVEQDVVNEASYIQAHTYKDVEALWNAEFGLWRGIRWKRSNMLPIISLLAGGGVNYTAVAANIGAAAAGETNFDAGSAVPVVVTRLDPMDGFEKVISALVSVTDAGTFSVAVSIVAGAPSGTYNIYVGMQGAAVATLQTQVTHVIGTADTRTFFKSGVASAANRFVTQATGPVAPPEPPATGNVHIAYIFGKDAFGVPKLGPKYQAMIPPAGPDKSDPLDQRRYVGYKNMFKAVILNVDRFRRLEVRSAYN